jgi:hypothetical protein
VIRKRNNDERLKDLEKIYLPRVDGVKIQKKKKG